MGLAAACRAAQAAQTLVIDWVHPCHSWHTVGFAIRAENANTFEDIALEWIDRTKADSPDCHRQQFGRVCKAEVCAAISDHPIRKMTKAHILKIARNIEKPGARWCSAILRCGQQSCGWRLPRQPP